MRATWKGNVVIQGTVTMPVALYTPTSSKQPRFKRLRAADSTLVKQQLVSAADGKVVQRTELTKGYPVGNGFKTFTTGEMKVPGPGKTLTVNAGDFVPRSQIPSGYRRGYYYVGTEEHTTELYEALRRVLEQDDLVAITEMQMRGTLYTAAIVPSNGHLELWTLWWADEVRDVPADVADRNTDCRTETERLIRIIAVDLVGVGEFTPRDNPARERLEELLEGKQVVAPEGDNVLHMGDHMDVLRTIVEREQRKIAQTTTPKQPQAEKGAA